MDQAQLIGIAIGLGVLLVLLLIIFFKANIVICQPNEVVIISGRKRRLADGSVQGYRILRGGRGFKRPLLESVRSLSLKSRAVDLHLSKALTTGMIPIHIEARANVKLAGRVEEGLDNAVERFLGTGVEAADRTAKQVLEGALRGVVATVSPEEANAQRLQLAEQVSERAQVELSRLGIVLDSFQIQSITDDQGYLEAIGRKRNAEVIRDAKIAEAEAAADARQVSAEQNRLGREAEIASEKAVIQYENSLEVERAQLLAEASKAQQRAAVAGEIARVEEETTLEAKRVEWSSKREEVETVIPARSKREAMLLEAEGRAARIVEEGRASAQAVELMREQWENGETQDLFLIRMLPELLDKVTRVVADNLRVDKLTILDGGQGDGLPTYVGNLTKSAVTMLEQLKNATGIDLEKLAEREGRQDSAAIPKDLG